MPAPWQMLVGTALTEWSCNYQLSCTHCERKIFRWLKQNGILQKEKFHYRNYGSISLTRPGILDWTESYQCRCDVHSESIHRTAFRIKQESWWIEGRPFSVLFHFPKMTSKLISKIQLIFSKIASIKHLCFLKKNKRPFGNGQNSEHAELQNLGMETNAKQQLECSGQRAPLRNLAIKVKDRDQLTDIP